MLAYIRSHWRGEQSLARSYWINGVALGIPFKILERAVEGFYPPRTELAPYISLVSIYYVLVLCWIIWFAVGLWRSATAHISSTRRQFWARFAQLIVVFNLLFVPLIIYGGGLTIWNLGLAALGKDGLVAAELSITESGYLLVDGHITFDTAGQFEKLLSENEGVKIVQLESGGGYLEPARIMAEMIKARELNTYTSVECSSACTDLFIAGDTRYADFDTILGFHQPGLEGLPDSAVAVLRADINSFFLERGVPKSFLDRVNSVPSSQIWVPTLKELVEANIITQIYDYNEDVTHLAADYCAAHDCTKLPPAENISEEALREPPG